MVFESLVADLLNRFLGSYIDNLNASQLNIGIWGGDVKLNNLDIKESALDELDLPVKLKFGFVQNLVLKIPWKNLYTEPTIVSVSGLYLIIVPNQGIIYNEQKANKNEQEAKQRKLTRLEENRRNRLKPKGQTDDTFTEKLVAQIIKNLQIRIKHVHVRYEDRFSNRERPFATGLTLDSLDFQTTDENFELVIQREAVKIFYKLISMSNLSLYSNANSGLISDLGDRNAVIDALRSSIATADEKPDAYKYVLQPLTINAKLKLNQKPEADESDWKIPKIDLAMELDKIALAIGKFQYQDFLLFLEAQERFNLSERYTKYRPNLNAFKGHYRDWWHFAYNCILNEHVRRRRNNWSWTRIKRHRKMLKDYMEAWIQMRTEKNPSASTKKTVQEAENELDVFNLNVARQQAEFEIDRRTELTRVEDQVEQGWVGWAKSWFGSGGGGTKGEAAEHGETDAKIMEKLEQAVTPEEKARLFEAIDYQENTPPTDYPKHFVENRVNFNLSSVMVALEDILEMRFSNLSAQFEQRPSANALSFNTRVQSLEMMAGDQSMLAMIDHDRAWLALKFETNPLEGGFDQLVFLDIAPVMFKYNAPAVNKTLDAFKPPESVRLHQLTALAIARYEEVKARSATALQHMVEQRQKLKLEIQIDPATIVLSHGGVFDEKKPALFAELGQLRMRTLEKTTEKAYQHIADTKLRDLMSRAYDNFQLSLSNLQLIYADTFASCMSAKGDCHSCHHLLKPTGMTVDVLRSTIDDLQLPLIRLFGDLPDVVLMISDDRLVKLLELMNSIPKPEFEEETVDLSAPVDVTNLRDRAKMMMIMETDELEDSVLQQQQKEEEKKEETEEEETKPISREMQIQLDLNMNLNEVGVIVSSRNRPFLSAHIRRLGLHMQKRMFDLVAKAHLGSLTVEMPQIEQLTEKMYLIDNEMLEGNHLIDITYRQASEESPTFKTEFRSNEQSIEFIFQILNFKLHKNALSDLMNFNNRLQQKLADIQPAQQQEAQHTMSLKKRTPSQSSLLSRQSSIERKSTKKRPKPLPVISRTKQQKKFVFQFQIHEIAAKLYAKQSDIAGGIDSSELEDAILEFCALNLQQLNLHGQMMEDGSMHVDIGLNAFTMDDKRKNSKVSRLMDKKDASSADKFISVKYNQNNNGDKFADVISSKFFLMLAPEFLGVLASFFVLHPPEEDEDVDQTINESDIFATPVSASGGTRPLGSGALVRSTPTAGMAGEQPTVAQSAPGSLTLNCKIYEIEVILIENSLRPDDSQAIILSFDALIDAKDVNGVQQLQGGVKHLKIFSTYFSPERRHLSNYPILQELDIPFSGSIDSKQKEQHFSLSMDTVSIRMSPSVIRLLSAVSTQFSEHRTISEAAKTSRASLREYSDYWVPKAIDKAKHWWFQTMNGSGPNESIVTEVAEDAKEAKDVQSSTERANFSVNRFVVMIEAGVRDFTRPMILLESTMKGSAENWSSNLIADSEARMQLSYYNEAYNVWEPVVEPVLHEDMSWQSWSLNLKIGPPEESEAQKQQQQATTSEKADKKKRELAGQEVERKVVPPPKMAVLIQATEMLNITVTKSFLQLLNSLSDSFEKAAKQISPPKSKQLPFTSSYLLINDTGLQISIRSTDTLVANPDSTKLTVCPQGEFIPLERSTIENSAMDMAAGNWQMAQDQRQVQMNLLLEEPKTERMINILRAETQCIQLPKEADSGKKWVLVVDTDLENARNLVTLRSLVKVVNHLEMPVQFLAYYDAQMLECGVVQPDVEKPLNIPLKALYTPDGELAIKPSGIGTGEDYEWSNKFSWHDFDKIKRRTVRCDEQLDAKKGIYIEIVVAQEKVQKGPRSAGCQLYTIHLFPPIHFVNMLPIPVQVNIPIEKSVAGGEGIDFHNLISGLALVISVEIAAEMYELRLTIPSVKEDLQVVKLHSKSSNKEMCVGLNWSTEFLRTTLSLYAPYWMVNETGKMLFYSSSASTEIQHSPDQNPLMLPLNERDFLDKKKAKLRLEGSEWTPDFPLDTAGSSGRITCKENGREYELTVDVQMCQNGLTKVIAISAFYLLQNDTKFEIEVREPNTKTWISIPPESVIGFWPVQKAKRKTLIARFPNTTEESVQFPFTEAFEGFCKVGNKFNGFYIIVSLSDDSSVTHLEQFVSGMAPAVLMNATKHPIEYGQSEDDSPNCVLHPGQAVPFAWNNLLSNRRLDWKSGDSAGSDELLRNRELTYLPSTTDGYHYCVSFLNGRQRILLFTDDAAVTFNATEAFEMEQPNMQVEFRLQGVGISLMNNQKGFEVLYMAISTGHGKEGFWLQYRQTDHQSTLHVKMHNFQIDNQLPSATFPCMLGMIPQPKSVVKNAPKPFLECSFVMNQSEHSNIVQIKLLEALVQEFAIRMDKILLNELLDLFPKESIEIVYTPDAFAKDIELTRGKLDKRAVQTRASQAKAYYERMHISPLMMHLSFSQGHAQDKEKKGEAVGIQWEFLNLMLKSVGVTLTEIQDVTFKLAFFQREAAFYSQSQLQNEIQTHYIRQFIKQAYVLVLGLDIIGNPFGLIRDLSMGVQDFFYQPIQGAVTGPLELIEGMGLGLNSLFSHTVGGVLGVASRITGTLGKGVAALTMDEEYQRKRLQARQPSNFGEGMYQGMRGVGQGVLDGVTGVISKPVEGAKKGGIMGFFKGTGKGLVGAVTRPVSGVVDLATSISDSVKTIISSDGSKAIRPPRPISADKIVRPFVFEEALGYKIFRETNKGDFAETDFFLTYGVITKDMVYIVTDKRIIESRRHEIGGNWVAEWSPTYAELKKPTKQGTKGIVIQLKDAKAASLFSRSKTKGKIIEFTSERVAQRVLERMVSAWESTA